jgi:hypothetical protein
MTVVTWIMKKSRLSRLVDSGGGVTVLGALRGAEERIGSMREEALAVVDETLARLESLTRAAPQGPAGPWLDEIYALSASLLDVAGPFGLEDMCAGAHSLCETADRQKASGRVTLPPIQVHVAALRLLRQPDEPAASRRQVLEGLEKLLAREPRVPA